MIDAKAMRDRAESAIAYGDPLERQQGQYILALLDERALLKMETELRDPNPDMLAALTEVRNTLRQRNQEGWESRLLGVVNTAIEKAGQR